MTQYVLAPRAASHLARIWRYLRNEAGEMVADRIEAEIKSRIAFLAMNPGAGHYRRDLTDKPVKFFPAYSWLIVYRPDTRPLQVVSILHARRDVANLLRERTS
jgi:antitoxin ParD1/3/4/toxin ParE1/3/4